MNLQTHARADAEVQDIHAVRHDLQSAQAWMENICGPHELKTSSPQRLHFQHDGNVLKSMSTVIGYIEYGIDVTIDIDASVLNSYSISLMTDSHLRHLPVVENKELLGLLSIGDLVKAAIAEQADLIHQLESYIRGH